MHDPLYDRLEVAKTIEATGLSGEEAERAAEAVKKFSSDYTEEKIDTYYPNNRAGRRARAKDARRVK